MVIVKNYMMVFYNLCVGVAWACDCFWTSD